MKSTAIKQLLLAALSTGIGATVQAQEIPQRQQAIEAMPTLSSNAARILAKPASVPPPASGKHARAPAPPLTAILVYAVGSSNCGWEYPSGTTTACDHGGAQLRTAVLEIGYGSNAIAWMAGGILPNSAMYASTPVCITGGYYSWPCTAGQTVVGFLNEYNLDGWQSGIFKYQNTSINSPWNTISTQISIL
jgi:hypothetical protein